MCTLSWHPTPRAVDCTHTYKVKKRRRGRERGKEREVSRRVGERNKAKDIRMTERREKKRLF